MARKNELELPNLYGHKCFLYFAAFFENVVLTKQLLTHWWIGEGRLDPSGSGDQTPEVKEIYNAPYFVFCCNYTGQRRDVFLITIPEDNSFGKSFGCS